MSALVVEGCAVATVDDADRRYADGHVVVTNGVLTAVGPGPAPATPGARRVDGRGCLLTPGLVNTHHHLYQWATRGFAADHTLFEWLTALYPVWAGLDADVVRAAATAGLARLAATGCTTTSDHHYVFPREGGDVLGATVDAGRSVGLRLTATRGSMDVGRSAGGLPPDNLVEGVDAVLTATAEAVSRHHDPSPDSMLRVAAAPCSPFSVSTRLLVEAAAQARQLGVRLHTHLAETLDEETYCRETFDCTPVEHLDRLGWLGPDVWLAHCVHPGPAGVARLAATGTGVAHCPQSNARLGAGTAPVRAMLDAGVPVGLGVDGAASNEHGGLAGELRQALYVARLAGGPTALAAHEALRLATAGGAAVLGRSDEVGALRVGLRGDLALWRVDGPLHGDLADPVVALVLGPTPPLELLTVEGRPVVEHGRVLTVDVEEAARDLRAARRRLLDRARA